MQPGNPGGALHMGNWDEAKRPRDLAIEKVWIYQYPDIPETHIIILYQNMP